MCQSHSVARSVAVWPQTCAGTRAAGEAAQIRVRFVAKRKKNGQNDLLSDATNGYTSAQQNAANGQRAI